MPGRNLTPLGVFCEKLVRMEHCGDDVDGCERRSEAAAAQPETGLKGRTRMSVVEQGDSNNAKILDGQGNPKGLVFPSRNNPKKPRDLHKAFDNAVKNAGLGNLPGSGKLRIHDLRHCCGSALIMRGVDVETVRKLLGHRDISTTQRYLHVVDDHMLQAISKIDDLGISPKSNDSINNHKEHGGYND